MVEPKLIIKGETLYSIEDYFTDLKQTFGKAGVEIQQDKLFKSMFMFILLSSEDKPIELLMKIFNMTKELVIDGQEVFKNEIEVLRAIQMKKYLDLYSEYFAGQKVTLNLLNLWIKEFLNRHIKGGNDEPT